MYSVNLLLCCVFAYLAIFCSTTTADPESGGSPGSLPSQAELPIHDSGAKINDNSGITQSLCSTKPRNEFRYRVTFRPQDDTHKKSQDFGLKKVPTRKQNSLKWKNSRKMANRYNDLVWTHTSFVNDIYKNDYLWSQERNLLLSPVALEVSLAAFSSEVAGTEVLKRVATSLFRVRVVVPRAWIFYWVFAPKNRFKITKRQIRAHYSKILRSLTYESVTLVSNLYIGEALQLDPQNTHLLKDYFNTQVHTMPSSFNFQGQTVPLLPPGMVYDDKLIILASALHFKGKWKIPFNPELTAKQTFYGEKGATMATFIGNTGKYYYVDRQAESYKILGLEFQKQDGPFLLLVFLPYESSSVDDLESNLAQSDWLRDLDLSASAVSPVHVSIPAFSIRDVWNFNSVLEEITQVDLSSLQGINQNAVLSIDESGASSYMTLSSAKEKEDTSRYYTGASVVGSPITGPGEALTFHANRPFVFALVHTDEKIILLQGHVAML